MYSLSLYGHKQTKMKDSDNRKINRKKNWDHNCYKKHEISDEKRFLNKAKKQFKKKLEDTRAEEVWDDIDEIY